MELKNAASCNNIAKVRECLARGYDVDGIRPGSTPLMEATRPECNIAIMLMLLHHGAELEASDTHQWTALHRAAGRGSVNAVWVLISQGGDINATDGIR